jgi:serine protease Do
MLGILARFTRRTGRPVWAALAISALVLPISPVPTIAARGPDNIADVAERVIDAVVNISTAQNVARNNATPAPPQLPNTDPQLDELFRDFFNNRRGGQNQNPGGNNNNNNNQPRRQNSLGSGFIIDASGLVVTNNHVIADGDEITVILNDGTRLKAELVGTDKKVDLALLRVQSDKPLKAVQFGDSDKLRLGEWVIAIGNPFNMGGTVTAGIVSARNRDINSGPYDNYIQTDAAINRGNSGGPLFNLEGEVIGINTAIISPGSGGGSVGIGFAVPAKTALAVIDQLKQFGETRRGWLGVRIQQVTDEIAESLGVKPPRGALVAGIEEKGPAKPAGIEPGDVIVKFDGKEVREMRDLPRIVADTPVGKEVDVVVVRKGKEENRKVTLGRLEDNERQQAALTSPTTPGPAPVVKKTLGLELSALSDDLRKKYKIKDSVKGIVILGIEANSPASDKRLNAGDVIVEIAQEAVTTADEFEAKIDKLKKEGRRTALLLITGPDGDTRFVPLPLQ